METNQIPESGLKGLKENWSSDLQSGFLVFLIALPLCLGISMASGFPPVSGIFTAIIGGILVSFFRGSNLTIKGPAAGLIVIALGAVEELGQGDPMRGYVLTLAVIVVAGAIQILFGLLRSGILGEFFPLSAVHGMLAAIGIIIISKQIHTLLGVKPEGKEPLQLLAEIPTSILNYNPEIAIIGLVSIFILFMMPLFKNPLLKKIPSPLIVILISIPIGLYFDLSHDHKYLFLDHHTYELGPKYLVTLPDNLFSAITFPDFSAIFSGTSIKYIIMFSLVGSLESLLSSKAIDGLDPFKRKSNHNRDMIGVGVGNMLAGMIGGLPMISEIVRSSANINNGAKTWWSNVFHGMFLLIFVAFFPKLIHQIPLTALAAMLIYTGLRLASPKEFRHMYKLGYDQFLVFIVTIIVVLSTDLLLGIAAGIILNIVMNIINGHPIKYLFRTKTGMKKDNEENYIVQVRGAVGFTNYIFFKNGLDKINSKNINLDFSTTTFIDHTVLDNIHRIQEDYSRSGKKIQLKNLNTLYGLSDHPLATKISNPGKFREERTMTEQQRRLNKFFKENRFGFSPKKIFIYDPFQKFPSLTKVRMNYIVNEASFQNEDYSIHYFEMVANDDGLVNQYSMHSSVFKIHAHHNIKIPDFILHTERLADKIIDVFEQKDINLENNHDFSSKFHLHSSSPEQLADYFSKEITDAIIPLSNVYMESNGQSVIILSNYIITSLEDLQRYLTAAQAISNGFVVKN